MKFLIHVDQSVPASVRAFLEHVGTLEEYRAGGSGSGYDLVVLDDAKAAAADGRDLIRRVLEGDGSILILGATESRKKEVGDLIGFSSHGDGAAYFVRALRDGAGRRHFRIHEQSFPESVDTFYQEVTGEGSTVTPVTEVEHVSIYRRGVDRADVPEDEMKRFAERVLTLISGGPLLSTLEGIPPGLVWRSWIYSMCQCWIALGEKTKVGTPPQQGISCETTYEFDGYLNNYPETGSFQYLMLRQSGIFQTNGMKNDNDHNRGWFLTQLAPEFRPAPQLFYYQSSPANANNTKTVTTGSSFEVNFSNQGVGATYQVNKSETEVIADWGVVQKSGSSWVYAQATPYSGTTLDFPSSAIKKDDKGEIKPLPTISKYSLQFDVQIVWKTNQLVNAAVDVACTNLTRVDYLLTEYYSGTKWDGRMWYSPVVWSPVYTINLGLLT